jgi:hypothetical protein
MSRDILKSKIPGISLDLALPRSSPKYEVAYKIAEKKQNEASLNSCGLSLTPDSFLERYVKQKTKEDISFSAIACALCIFRGLFFINALHGHVISLIRPFRLFNCSMVALKLPQGKMRSPS